MPEPTQPRVDPAEEGTTKGAQDLLRNLRLPPLPDVSDPVSPMRRAMEEAFATINAERGVDPTDEGTTTSPITEEVLLVLQLLWKAPEEVLQLLRKLPPEAKRVVAERAAHARWGEPRPDAEDEAEAEAVISADIDAIVKRLDEGIPRLSARLDALLERQRRPLTV